MFLFPSQKFSSKYHRTFQTYLEKYLKSIDHQFRNEINENHIHWLYGNSKFLHEAVFILSTCHSFIIKFTLFVHDIINIGIGNMISFSLTFLSFSHIFLLIISTAVCYVIICMLLRSMQVLMLISGEINLMFYQKIE